MLTSTASESKEIMRLAGRIRAHVNDVLDLDEVAAIIESLGITDQIAEQDYGERGVYPLAAHVEAILNHSQVSPIRDGEEEDDPPLYGYENLFTAAFHKLGLSRAYHWGQHFSRVHLQGFFFATPMIISMVALLVLQVSLWAAVIHDLQVATAMGLGTVGSFIVTGGYSQAIGRRGIFYRLQEEHALKRTVCYYFVGVGLEVVLVVGVAAFCLNAVLGILTIRLSLIALTYYLFLSLLWLFVSILYMLGQPLLFTPIVVVGIIIVYVFQHFGLSLIVRQSLAMILTASLAFLGGYITFARDAARHVRLVWSGLSAAALMTLTLAVLSGWYEDLVIGICVVALLCVSVILFQFARQEARQQEETQASTLPSAPLLWYKVGPYFVYGVLYYAFLFMDRLIAWSTPDQSVVERAFLFRATYEAGMDWGLVVLFCTMGIAESTINSFSERIRDDEQRCSIQEPGTLSQIYLRFYALRGIFFLLFSLLTGVGLWFGVLDIAHHSTLPEIRVFLESMPQKVFLISAPGYTLLSWALLNNIFLFALSRPERVLPPVVAALVVHAILSYVLTRLYGHSYACVGFLAGSLLMAVWSTIAVVQVIRRLDYYYYSAYL